MRQIIFGLLLCCLYLAPFTESRVLPELEGDDADVIESTFGRLTCTEVYSACQSDRDCCSGYCGQMLSGFSGTCEEAAIPTLDRILTRVKRAKRRFPRKIRKASMAWKLRQHRGRQRAKSRPIRKASVAYKQGQRRHTSKKLRGSTKSRSKSLRYTDEPYSCPRCGQTTNARFYHAVTNEQRASGKLPAIKDAQFCPNCEIKPKSDSGVKTEKVSDQKDRFVPYTAQTREVTNQDGKTVNRVEYHETEIGKGDVQRGQKKGTPTTDKSRKQKDELSGAEAKKGDQAGHVSDVGPGEGSNIVPMNKEINNGGYKALETETKRIINDLPDDNAKVTRATSLTYSGDNASRPDQLLVKVTDQNNNVLSYARVENPIKKTPPPDKAKVPVTRPDGTTEVVEVKNPFQQKKTDESSSSDSEDLPAPGA